MKNPVLELKEIFAPPRTQFIGVVVQVNGSTVRVKVSTGIIECQGSGTYIEGDSVLVRDRLILSRVLPKSAVPVYQI